MEDTQEEVNPSREHIIDILKPVVQKAKVPLPKPPPPFPQRLANYAKFMKDLVTNKRSINFETIKVTHQVSAIAHYMAPKLEDAGDFTIPCTIRSANFAKALYDIGESINLLAYSMFKTLGIGKPRPISMRLQMDDCTSKVVCDVEAREITFRVGDEQVVFHVCKSMRQPTSNEVCYFVDSVTDVIIDDTSATINVGDMLEGIFLNLDDDEIDGFMECVNSL
ncbi:uncharacterized protein [Nicotiana tomentosiformis]|uniref:uncharacterized protein n=1 Tax=Nicotiana tomentosiformis TaxID=4098 RepID=UPI00388C9EED